MKCKYCGEDNGSTESCNSSYVNPLFASFSSSNLNTSSFVSSKVFFFVILFSSIIYLSQLALVETQEYQDDFEQVHLTFY